MADWTPDVRQMLAAQQLQKQNPVIRPDPSPAPRRAMTARNAVTPASGPVTPGAMAGAKTGAETGKAGDKKGMKEETKQTMLAAGLGALGGVGAALAEGLLARGYAQPEYKTGYGGASVGGVGSTGGVPAGLYRDRQAIPTDRPSLALALLQRGGR